MRDQELGVSNRPLSSIGITTFVVNPADLLFGCPLGDQLPMKEDLVGDTEVLRRVRVFGA